MFNVGCTSPGTKDGAPKLSTNRRPHRDTVHHESKKRKVPQRPRPPWRPHAASKPGQTAGKCQTTNAWMLTASPRAHCTSFAHSSGRSRLRFSCRIFRVSPLLRSIPSLSAYVCFFNGRFIALLVISDIFGTGCSTYIPFSEHRAPRLSPWSGTQSSPG